MASSSSSNNNPDYRRSLSAPVQPESIDRGGNTSITSLMGANSMISPPGALLRPAHELGVAMTPKKKTNKKRSNSTPGSSSYDNDDDNHHPEQEEEAHQRTPVNIHSERLQRLAKKSFLERLPAAAADFNHQLPIASFCYQGMEVMFGGTETTLYVISPRTELVYQAFALPAPIRTMCRYNGTVCVLCQNNQVILYHPQPADPLQVAFGRYRWHATVCAIDTSSLMDQEQDETTTNIIKVVKIASNNRLLVARGKFLAIYDGTTFELLWMTQLQNDVGMAAISPNGDRIAVSIANDDDDPPGVYTFTHDALEDGSRCRTTLTRQRSVGVVYKPGAFLVHGKTPVVAMEFITAAAAGTTKNNNTSACLLLTVTRRTARIFGKQQQQPQKDSSSSFQLSLLTEWAILNGTVVTWMEGIPALFLADLETKGISLNNNAATNIRSTTMRHHHHHHATSSGTSTIGGGYICEIDFNGNVRISKLMLARRGTDDYKIYLNELTCSGVLPVPLPGTTNSCCSGMQVVCVSGVWPVHAPAEPATEPKTSVASLGLSGSMMIGNDSNNNTVPTQVRIVCGVPGGSIAIYDAIVDETAENLRTSYKRLSLMHLDRDFDPTAPRILQAAIPYDSGQLVAERQEAKHNMVRLVYRSPGTMSLLPENWRDSDAQRAAAAFEGSTSLDRLQDESLLPVPLLLSSLRVAQDDDDDDQGNIAAMLWWPDEAYRGAPRLVVILDTGTVLVYDIPPVWSFLEPLESNYCSYDCSLSGVGSGEEARGGSPAQLQEDEEPDKYVVSIVPDPEFGLGLRLESHADGMCAIAGSYKRHPINNDILPAEKSGSICLGDELLSADDFILEDQPFDDIISIVRDLGTNSGPGNPIVLKFRRKGRTTDSLGSRSRGRRNVEQIIGLPSGATKNSRSIGQSGAAPPISEGEASLRLLAAKFTNAVSFRQQKTKDCFSLAPIDDVDGFKTQQALLFWSDRLSLKVNTISIGSRADSNDHSCDCIGETSLNMVGGDIKITALQVIKTSPHDFSIFSCISSGEIVLSTFALPGTEDDKETPGFTSALKLIHLHSPWTEECQLRVYSTMLFATLQPKHGSTDEIFVWSGSPRPNIVKSNSSEELSDIFFSGSNVSTRRQSNEGDILEFGFARPGFIDTDPLLVLQSTTRIVFYSKPCWEPLWKQRLSVQYSRDPLPPSQRSGGERCCNNVPELVYPHLRASCLAAYNSVDETNNFCSSWHPDYLLAQIFSNEAGVESALSVTKVLFEWLSSSGQGVPIDQRYSPLIVGPIEGDTSVIPHTSSGASIFNLTTNLLTHIDATISRKRQKVIKGPSTATDEKENVDSNLPGILLEMDPHELRVVWAIAESVTSSLDLATVDHPGQFALYAEFIFSRLVTYSDGPGNKPKLPSMPSHFMMVRSSSISREITREQAPTMPSSAALAALLSSDQSILLDRICEGRTLTWPFVSSRRITFWARSDAKVAEICAKVGQATFLKSRDIMECALFFIVANKVPTLRNFAATDQSSTGSTFSQFLGKFDFTSERGRQAAEKNAFSLLRKCKFQAAAAFFLLAEPPFLKAAVETIATKSHDMDLAFLIARLMESPSRASWTGGRTLSSALGGGGGYAAVPAAPIFSTSRGKESYFDWSPTLGMHSRELLIDRILPDFSKDDKLGAVALLWLKRNEEAAWLLSGHIASDNIRTVEYSTAQNALCRSCKLLHDLRISKDDEKGYITTRRANAIIDASSSPQLLRFLHSKGEVLTATALNTARLLNAQGIELPSLQALALSKSPSSVVRKDESNAESEIPNTIKITNTAPTSSIFDDFDVAPPSSQKAPSIFDSFDPPKKPALASSIFDNFDVPSQHKTSKAHEPTGPVQSSIFDDYDTPIRKPIGNRPSDNVSDDKTIAQSNPQTGEDGGVQAIYTPFVLKEWSNTGLWDSWGSVMQTDILSRRLIREIATLLAGFYGDPMELPIKQFIKDPCSLVSPCVAEILQMPCDSQVILTEIQAKVTMLASISGRSNASITEKSLRLLGFSRSRRILFSVLLHLMSNRPDRAEEVIRGAANGLIQLSKAFTTSFDDLSSNGSNRFRATSHYIRKEAARISWQLEACLWLNHGEGLRLSGVAQKEAICAVRIGLLLTSWNIDFFCINQLLSCEADFPFDDESGRQLWTSVKLSDPSNSMASSQRASSGGWEFLVNCKRSQSTELLRERPTGTFIIRPHPADDSVFTLSFKTNLLPSKADDNQNKAEETIQTTPPDGKADTESAVVGSKKKRAKQDDVVQHAIIRLSDSGFRCGSFGPFTSLSSLLDAVSGSLPFKLRFDLPPKNRIIPEDRHQVSPNAVLLRQLTLRSASDLISDSPVVSKSRTAAPRNGNKSEFAKDEHTALRLECFGFLLQNLMLSMFRKQVCGYAAAEFDNVPTNDEKRTENNNASATTVVSSGTNRSLRDQEHARLRYYESARFLRPLLEWGRVNELAFIDTLFPELDMQKVPRFLPQCDPETGEIDQAPTSNSILRGLVQPDSGVDFSTLRLIDGGDCTMLILFRQRDAINWIVENGIEVTRESATRLLQRIENERVIEQIEVDALPLKKTHDHAGEDSVRYRIIDPWEVEVVKTREGENQNAAIGRQLYATFSLGQVALSTEQVLRQLGGVALLETWANLHGGVALTKAFSSVFPPLQRAGRSHEQFDRARLLETSQFVANIRQALYRNCLFRRLSLPQRFLALVQVEMLDLKNLTSPSGTISLTAYALLRLKRAGQGVITNKARTIDTAVTPPMKLAKSTVSGPNSPASWGSVVRFRFPLPEEACWDGSSHDPDQDVLFKGPPCVLQVAVYEKRLLVDHSLGVADIRMDDLGPSGLEEWVPLKTESRTISWFARIRLTLRFELMCLDDDPKHRIPGVGAQRIKDLARSGGSAQEDTQKRSVSSPDLLGYFESIAF